MLWLLAFLLVAASCYFVECRNGNRVNKLIIEYTIYVKLAVVVASYIVSFPLFILFVMSLEIILASCIILNSTYKFAREYAIILFGSVTLSLVWLFDWYYNLGLLYVGTKPVIVHAILSFLTVAQLGILIGAAFDSGGGNTFLGRLLMGTRRAKS